MEITSKGIKEFFLTERKPFTAKRDINWGKVKISIGLLLVMIFLLIIIWPTTPEEVTVFHEKTESGVIVSTQAELDPTEETVQQFQRGRTHSESVPASLDYLYKEDAPSIRSGSGSGMPEKNSSMILVRSGNDAKTRLLPGTKFLVVLPEKMNVSDQSMPVIGIIKKDVEQENSIAIPEGSKLIGEISFDSSRERALVNWKSLVTPDGRERPISGIAASKDGQVGIEGDVKSDDLKNMVGHTVTRFVGAYAEGSMSHGQFGANEGGHKNGIKNAIAETAKDQANDFGEELSKEKKWIELQMGSEFYTVLNQPFIFRDPGATNGG